MNRSLDHLLTEIAERLRLQQQVPVSASRLVEGCRDGLDGEAHTPVHRRSEAWRDGFELGSKFREALSS